MKLKVIQPFNGHVVGEEIINEDEIKMILNSEQSHYVVKVQDDTIPPKATIKK